MRWRAGATLLVALLGGVRGWPLPHHHHGDGLDPSQPGAGHDAGLAGPGTSSLISSSASLTGSRAPLPTTPPSPSSVVAVTAYSINVPSSEPQLAPPAGTDAPPAGLTMTSSTTDVPDCPPATSVGGDPGSLTSSAKQWQPSLRMASLLGLVALGLQCYM